MSFLLQVTERNQLTLHAPPNGAQTVNTEPSDFFYMSDSLVLLQFSLPTPAAPSGESDAVYTYHFTLGSSKMSSFVSYIVQITMYANVQNTSDNYVGNVSTNAIADPSHGVTAQYQITYITPGQTQATVVLGLAPQRVALAYNSLNGPLWLVNNLPGTYYLTNLDTNEVSNAVDFRSLAAVITSVIPPRFNSHDLDAGTTISGYMTGLPTTSPGYANGWAPTDSISSSIYFALGDGNTTLEGQVTVFTPYTVVDYQTDQIAVNSSNAWNYSYFWNGVNQTTNLPAEGQYQSIVIANASVPGGGVDGNLTIYTDGYEPSYGWPTTTELICTRCSPLDGSSRTEVSLPLAQNPFGQDMSFNAYYNNIYSNSAPSSLGYGWKNINNALVQADGSGNLYYTTETGFSQKWLYNPNSATYSPYTSDNYLLAEHDATNGLYIITFQDQSLRKFSVPSGKLTIEVDRNGNSLTYNYDPTYGWLSSVVDNTPAARTISYNYGSRMDGQPVSVTDSIRTIQLSYFPSTDTNSPNRLQSITDANGNITSYTYYQNGPLKTVTVPAIPGGTATTEVAWAWTYDSTGRKLTEQYYDQSVTNYTYGQDVLTGVLTNAVSMVVHDLTSPPSPDQTTVSYFDANFNIVAVYEYVSPGVVNMTTMAYDDTVSNNPYLVTQIVDPNLNQTLMTYNINGNLQTYTQVFSDGNHYTTTYVYSEDTGPMHDPTPQKQNLPVSITRPTVSGVAYPATFLTYDGKGNLATITDPGGYVTTYTRTSPDNTGLIDNIVVTDPANGGFSREVKFTYDPNTKNLLTIALDPSGQNRVTTMTYDASDNVATVADQESPPNIAHFLYDGNRQVTTYTDPRTKQYVMTYLQNQLTQMQLPSNSGSGGSVRNVYYDYDTSNRLSTLKRDDGTTAAQLKATYAYDGFSQVLSLTRNQVSGGTPSVYSNTYDALGRAMSLTVPLTGTTHVEYAPYCSQQTVTTPRGVITTRVSDVLCRVTQLSNQSEARLFQYDELSRLTSDLKGGAVFSGSPPGTFGSKFGQSTFGTDGRGYLYDALDRVTKITFSDGTYVSYAYDAVGNVTTYQDVFLNTTAYSYTNDNYLSEVSYTKHLDTTVYSCLYSYDVAGRPTVVTYQEAGVTFMTLNFSDASGNTGWNQNGQLMHMRYLNGSGANIQSFDYQYDDSGNRTMMTDTPASGVAITWNYGYDWLDRLTSVTNGTHTAGYAYDNSDNRTSITLNGTPYMFNNDLADRLTSRQLPGSATEDFLYDNDGNMTTRTLSNDASNPTTYTWSGFNNLIQFSQSGVVQEAEAYDTSGSRKSKSPNTMNATRFYDTDGTACAENRPTGPVSFIRGPQMLGLEQGGNVYYYITDGLGSVRQVVKSDGTSVASFATDEFGVPTASSGSAELLAHTYVGSLGVRNETGQPTGISNNSLYLMSQRWYDPQLGRFLSRDPIGFNGGLNLYSYTTSPTNYVDPSGLAPDFGNGPQSGVIQAGYQLFKQTVNASSDSSLKEVLQNAEASNVTIQFGDLPANRNAETSASGIVLNRNLLDFGNNDQIRKILALVIGHELTHKKQLDKDPCLKNATSISSSKRRQLEDEAYRNEYKFAKLFLTQETLANMSPTTSWAATVLKDEIYSLKIYNLTGGYGKTWDKFVNIYNK
jgi:RHS repeat-associated protein